MKRSAALPPWIKRLFEAATVGNLKLVKRIIVSIIGATVLLIGIALLVLPGPGFIVIVIGLGILATEYAWARRWLKKARQFAIDARQVASDVVSRRAPAGGEESRL
jgi:tellurite resistance protein TerC